MLYYVEETKRLGLRKNTDIPVYCSTWTKNVVSQYMFSIPIYRVNWSGSEFWFELKMADALNRCKHERKVGGFDIVNVQRVFLKSKYICWHADIIDKESEEGTGQL